jgi:hypothetical protein
VKHLIALILSIPQSLMAGLVFSKSWNWFIIRKFENMPRLNTLDAVGILFVAGLVLLPFAVMMGRRDIKEKHPDKDDGSISIAISLIMTLFAYPLVLGIAALWHLVIG